MFEGLIMAQGAKKLGLFDEKEVFKTVKKHAALGSLLMALPDFGLGGVFFAAVLWSMYSSVCKKVGVSFSENRSKLIGLGMVVNIGVAFILDFATAALFFITPFLAYLQFYLSGKFFVDRVKKMNLGANQVSMDKTVSFKSTDHQQNTPPHSQTYR